jgi:methyl-accepting chemotaxis protein
MHLEQALAQQSVFQTQIGESTQSLSNLKVKADAIGSIVSTINQLADQTNMLALNAAIEAARAGEQGRGFAVVADEVRELAKKTTDATNGIEGVLSEIASATAESVHAIEGVSQSGDKMAELINATAEVVKQNNDTAYTAKSAMEQVLRTVEEHNQTNQGITQNVRTLVSGTKELEGDLGEVSSKVLGLCNQTEDIFRQLHVFGLQNRNSLVKDVVLSAAAAVGEAFEQAISTGQISEQALFDMRYDQIENTNPPKFTTPFDTFTDQVLPAIQEPIVTQYNYMIYAGAVDKNGYFPTHNKKFSKPLTGDYDTDLANNRTKRIFDDYTGKRCGSNTETFLLQTYKRDTGEVMHDLSAPIFVFGKHWGGFRIGYKAQ